MKNLGMNPKLLGSILLALTLGLAPFIPEPHIVEKIKWIAGGADGMQMVDFFDLLLHGSPWVYLFVMLIITFSQSNNTR